jgi:hypothetical protein
MATHPEQRFCQAFGLPLPTFQPPTLAASSDAGGILPPAFVAPAPKAPRLVNNQGTSRDNCHMLDKEVNSPNSFHHDVDGNNTDDIDNIQSDADEPFSPPSYPYSSTPFPSPNPAPYRKSVPLPLSSKPSPNPTPTDSHYSTQRNLCLPNLRTIFPEDLTLATLSVLNPAFIVAGIFSPLGLPNMNVLGGVWSTAFIKDVINKHRKVLKSVELYGPEHIPTPKSLICLLPQGSFNQTPIVYARTINECFTSIDKNLAQLLLPKNGVANPNDNLNNIKYISDYKTRFQDKVTTLLPLSPSDSVQPNHILYRFCLTHFHFIYFNRACLHGIHLLGDDFLDDFDTITKSLVLTKPTQTTFDSIFRNILIISGYACTRVSCYALGETAYLCPACNKGTGHLEVFPSKSSNTDIDTSHKILEQLNPPFLTTTPLLIIPCKVLTTPLLLLTLVFTKITNIPLLLLPLLSSPPLLYSLKSSIISI